MGILLGVKAYFYFNKSTPNSFPVHIVVHLNLSSPNLSPHLRSGSHNCLHSIKSFPPPPVRVPQILSPSHMVVQLNLSSPNLSPHLRSGSHNCLHPIKSFPLPLRVPQIFSYNQIFYPQIFPPQLLSSYQIFHPHMLSPLRPQRQTSPSFFA